MLLKKLVGSSDSIYFHLLCRVSLFFSLPPSNSSSLYIFDFFCSFQESKNKSKIVSYSALKVGSERSEPLLRSSAYYPKPRRNFAEIINFAK